VVGQICVWNAKWAAALEQEALSCLTRLEVYSGRVRNVNIFIVFNQMIKLARPLSQMKSKSESTQGFRKLSPDP